MIAPMRFTHASRCDRRIDFKGRSAKVAELVARFIARTLPDTQTCRADHCEK